MRDILDVENYFPDRPPTWLDVITIISGLGMIALWWQPVEAQSLPAVALGVGSMAFGVVTGARTRAGQRVGRWWMSIGLWGRGAVIVLFVILSIVAFRYEATPTALIGDFGAGLVAGGILLMAAHVVHERRVEGWFSKTQ